MGLLSWLLKRHLEGPTCQITVLLLQERRLDPMKSWPVLLLLLLFLALLRIVVIIFYILLLFWLLQVRHLSWTSTGEIVLSLDQWLVELAENILTTILILLILWPFLD